MAGGRPAGRSVGVVCLGRVDRNSVGPEDHRPAAPDRNHKFPTVDALDGAMDENGLPVQFAAKTGCDVKGVGPVTRREPFRTHGCRIGFARDGDFDGRRVRTRRALSGVCGPQTPGCSAAQRGSSTTRSRRTGACGALVALHSGGRAAVAQRTCPDQPFRQSPGWESNPRPTHTSASQGVRANCSYATTRSVSGPEDNAVATVDDHSIPMVRARRGHASRCRVFI